MSKNEQTNIPMELNLLDENKKIIDLNSNHETILEKITTELESNKYNSVVTMENYKVSKEAATELNKTSTFINKFKIAKVKLETQDIEVFKGNCKLYQELIQNKRETILKGLAVFEEETRKQVLKVCEEYADDFARNKAWLREEFIKKVDVSDMSLTGYMTAKGAISKKGKDEVERRVNLQLTMQNKVDNRILSLENQCLKAGIEPLTVEHIQGFLYADDEAYNAQLESLINAEIERNERIKEEAKAKAEKEAAERVKREQKALKDELHARYESEIKMADMPNLTRINIELKSYDEAATYELRQLSTKREQELLEPKVEEVQEVDETPQEEHLKSIQEETISQRQENDKEEVVEEQPKAVDGKVEKTLSIKIRVPEVATDEQVIGAVINMIKAGTFPIENIEVK